MTFSRHDLVWPTAAGWKRLGSEAKDDEARYATNLWRTRDWPLIVRRPAAHERHDAAMLTLGLPLPPAQGKRRLAMRVATGHVARCAPPITLEQAIPSLPAEWQRAAASLMHDARSVGIRLRVYGGAAWQAITGLEYLHDASDLDLLCPLREPDEIDKALTLLERFEHALRVDGEIVFPCGGAVAWREWRNASSTSRVLVKRFDDAALVSREDLLRSFGEPATRPPSVQHEAMLEQTP